MGAAAAAGGLVGGVLGAVGQVESNKEEAMYERQNAHFIKEQMRMLQMSSDMEMERLNREEAVFVGNQKSTLASNGVDMSGTALLMILDSKEAIRSDKATLRIETDSRMNLARIRADQHMNRARHLSSDGLNNMTLVSGLLGGMIGAGQAASQGGGSSGLKKTKTEVV